MSQPPAAGSPSQPGQSAELGQWFDQEVTVVLAVDDAVLNLPVGLDGIARTATNTPTGGPVALSGAWADAVLSIDYEEMFGPDHWTIQIDLASTFTMTVTDLAGMFPPMVIAGSLAS